MLPYRVRSAAPSAVPQEQRATTHLVAALEAPSQCTPPFPLTFEPAPVSSATNPRPAPPLPIPPDDLRARVPAGRVCLPGQLAQHSFPRTEVVPWTWARNLTASRENGQLQFGYLAVYIPSE